MTLGIASIQDTMAKKIERRPRQGGRARLELPNHGNLLMAELGVLADQPQYQDLKLVLGDGERWCHSLVLSSMSPFIRTLLQAAHTPDTTDWIRDEAPVLLLPDIALHEMELLLSLLYTGRVNIYRAELPRIVSLTHLLKLVSIPVALAEQPWTKRQRLPSPLPADTRAVISYVTAAAKGSGDPGVVQPRTKARNTNTSAFVRATPPNILMPNSSVGGGKNLVSQKHSNCVTLRPLLGPPDLTSAVATVVSLDDVNNKLVGVIPSTQQHLVIVNHPASEFFLPPNYTTLSLSDSSGDRPPYHARLKDPLTSDEVGEESDIEEIEIFLNGDGEVERMEVCQSFDKAAQSGKDIDVVDSRAAACDGMVGKEDFAAVMNIPDSGHIHAVREGSFMTELDMDSTRSCLVQHNGQTVTVLQAGSGNGADGEGLDNLISVAEAFEKSQQPDFNDIASPVVDGTDTERLLVKICVLCGKALLGRKALGRHMKNAHPKVFGPYPCPREGCPKLLESGRKVLAHMPLHAANKGGRESEPEATLHKCDRCDYRATAEARLADHVKLVHNSGVGGEEVSAPLSELSQPRASKKVSASTAQLECNAEDPACSESFVTALQFIQHMRSEHGLPPWRCEVCAKRFQDRQNYRFHALSHGGRKNFTCDICTKSYSNPRQLYAHRALHLGKRFLCNKCGYKARSSANLRGHIRNLHETNRLACDQCGRSFKSRSNLKSHQRIHTGELPFACELCEVRFKRSHHLNNHIESKGHLDTMERARRDGVRIPVRLDPLRRKRGRPAVEEGPVTLLRTTASGIDDNRQRPISSSDGIEDEPPSPLGQVVVLEEKCTDLLDAYVIPDGHIEIIRQ